MSKEIELAAGSALKASERGVSMQSLIRDLAASLRNPEFWALSSWLDIVVKNRQSRLGIFWLISPVIVYVWGVGLFFATMMGQPLHIHGAYIATGYVVFRVVSSIVTEATLAFSGSAAFILDGHVRLTDFVLRVAATAVFHFAISLPVVVVALAFYPDPQWSGMLLALVSLPIVILNAIWVAVLFALVGARFPDLRHLVGNIFMFTFLLTPVIWRADMMRADSLRGMLMRFNPFYHLLEVVRAPILGTPVDSWTLPYLAVMTPLGCLLAIVAYRRYARFVPLWI